jgi:SAM-dependent methyltransferase
MAQKTLKPNQALTGLRSRAARYCSSVVGRLAGRFAGPASYNEINAKDAASRLDIKRAKVLVVGANTGGDCREFIKLGANEVHGLDVVAEVGAEFKHPSVTYHRQSIERTDLTSDSFDLVYSFASPLWFSPYGHHMGCFHGHPWVHVVYDRQGVIDYAKGNGIDGERGHSIEAIVDYMLDKTNFNMTPSIEYAEAVRSLKNMLIVENSLIREPSLIMTLVERRLLSGTPPMIFCPSPIGS